MILDMNLVDLCEMICDWCGRLVELSPAEAIKVIDRQQKRFHFSDELGFIMKNTLLDYFTWIKDDEADTKKADDTNPNVEVSPRIMFLFSMYTVIAYNIRLYPTFLKKNSGNIDAS